jgi:hypothetical protein
MRLNCVVVMVLCLGSASFADERNIAREHFLKGSKAFDLGLYEKAVEEYMAAYEAKDDPALLYNIAQAHRLAGHSSEALRFYRVFLSKVPQAKNRAEVELKINELQKLVDHQRRTQDLPPDGALRPSTGDTTASTGPNDKPATSSETTQATEPAHPAATTPTGASSRPDLTAPPPSKPLVKRPWFWAVVGGGAVAVGLAVGLGVGLGGSAKDPSASLGALKVN